VVNDFARIQGEHSVQDDLAAVNPDYGLNSPADRQRNCGNCIAAYELRRRGFNVEALARENGMHVDDWAALFEGFQKQTPVSKTKIGVVKELTDTILKWDDGRNVVRGTVFGLWDGNMGLGHFFSFEVRDGTVKFLDSQNGKDDVSYYFERMNPATIIYGRLDNLMPSASIINAVKGKE
jgi:hypothetical protein